METEKYAPHTTPGTQERYTRLCTYYQKHGGCTILDCTITMYICMYIEDVLKQGGGGNHT